MLFAQRNLRVIATFSILTASALVACVSGLPGGALDDHSSGAAGSSGAGAPGAGGGGGKGMPFGGSGTGPSGPGLGGTPGPAVTGTAGMASGGSGGSAFLLVPDGGRPLNIAADSQYVYWGDIRTQSIMKVSVEGGAPVGLAPSTTGGAWVAVDSTGNVYWSTSGSIMKLANGAGPPTELVSDTHITQLVAGADAVFWIADDPTPLSSRVMKIGRDGGAPTLLASGQAQANAIAVDAMNAYWSSPANGTVMKVGVSGGDPIQLTASANFSGGLRNLAVDTTSVYWVDGLSHVVMKVAIEGGSHDPTVFAPVMAMSVAADASGVYWADPGGTVFVARDASGARQLGSAGAGPGLGVTLDAKNVYWIATGLGSIFRAPK